MNIRLLGALIVMAGCGGFGSLTAAAHRQRERELRQLIRGLDFMDCELQYRMTPLPELCRQTSLETGGTVGRVFAALAEELERQISPDVASCMAAAVGQAGLNSERLAGDLKLLGSSLGRFDLPGQIKGLDGVRQSCRRQLEELGRDREVRLRSYQTLGLCAGAALVILFL